MKEVLLECKLVADDNGAARDYFDLMKTAKGNSKYSFLCRATLELDEKDFIDFENQGCLKSFCFKIDSNGDAVAD